MITLQQLKDNNALQVFETSKQVSEAAAKLILSIAEKAIKERGKFKLVVAGGTTPLATYRLLKDSDANWYRWHIFYGDERCLKPTDPERNSTMIKDAWLDHVSIPEVNIHTMKAASGPVNAANEYSTIIEEAMPFDLVILGMGEDGHTASLFPGHQHPIDAFVVPVYNAPKPPPERVSLSHKALSTSEQILLLITGSSKKDALNLWSNGEALPINTFSPKLDIKLFMDREANNNF